MILLGWILRILLILLVIRLVVRLVAGVFQGLTGSGSAGGVGAGDGRSRRPAAVPLAKDPVCGTYVVPNKALTAAADGTTHYFCSEACRRAFDRGRRTSRSA